MQRILTLFLSLIFIISIHGCVDRTAQDQAKKNEKILLNPVMPVIAMRVEMKEIIATLDIVGNINALQNSAIGPKVNGRLTQVFVKDGDVVKAGQILAQQDITDYEAQLKQAEASIKSSQASLSQAKLNEKIGPQRSSIAVSTARSQLEQSKANLEKLKTGGRPEEKVQADSALKAAKIALEVSKRAYDRSEFLYKKGAVSKQDFDNAENALSSARNQYKQAVENREIAYKGARKEDIVTAEQQVRAAQNSLKDAIANKRLDPNLREQVKAAQANLSSSMQQAVIARKALTDTAIVAPFNGRISGSPLEIGTYVIPGTAIATVVGYSGMYFEGLVPEKTISNVKIGQSIEVSVDALKNQRIIGTIVGLNPVAQSIGRNFNMRIQIPTNIPDLKAGMFARGFIKYKTIPNAVVMSVDALQGEHNKYYVYIVENNKAKKVQVEIGTRNGRLIQVKGLNDGQIVVVAGQKQLINGTPVRIEKITQGYPYQSIK